MTLQIELAGFPMVNQLNDLKPSDGFPDENARYNCVPASLEACIRYYTGRRVPADDLKDAVYGQGHVGGGDEAAYRPLLRDKYHLGLSFHATRSASEDLIEQLRVSLLAGQPALVTMHSHWSTPWFEDSHDGYHAGAVYGIDRDDSGNLALMNPWGGFRHEKPIAWWRDRLGIGVCPLAKLADPPAYQLPAGWSDDGTTLRGGNGQPVVKGFRDYVIEKLHLNLWGGGYAYGAEFNDGADGSIQIFADAVLLWDPRNGVREGTLADACRIAAHVKEGKAA